MKVTLKGLRAMRNWTQKEAAESIGVSVETWANYEKGKTYPDVPIIKLIEKAFNVTYNDIIFSPIGYGLTVKKETTKLGGKKMKTENWNGHDIRFVNSDNEWWAVAKDVAEALGYPETNAMTKRLDKNDLMSDKLSGMNMKSVLVNEFGIYDAVFGSHKKEAKQFKRWIFNIIKELRQSTGLEGFHVFRMLDKEHQKSAMQNLKKSLRKPVRVDFIKANTIANKAVSNLHGFPKMVKKSEMTPEMLVERQEILDSTVELMVVKDKYGLQLSVSKQIYTNPLNSQKQVS